MEKDIYIYINKVFQGEFTRLNYNYYNLLFYGFSKKYNQKVFLKLFPKYREDRFLNELNALKNNNNNFFVDNFESENYFILILKYLEFVDLDKNYFNKKENIEKLAILLAEFHNQDNPDIICKGRNIIDRINDNINRIKARKEYPEVLEIWNKLKINSLSVSEEYDNYIKKDIHGDVWIGNIKLHNDKLILLDFERSKKDIYYLDFLKIFYEEFYTDKEKINFFLESYYAISNNEKISKELEIYLLFYTGLGILSFTINFQDKNFERTGFRMIEDVKKILEI